MKTVHSLSTSPASSSSSSSSASKRSWNKNNNRNNKVRIELFFSSEDELRQRISFLRSKGISSFNLVNKSNKDETLKHAQIIEDEFLLPSSESSDKDCHGRGSGNDGDVVDDDSGVSICAHYSIKYHKSRKLDGAFQNLQDFVERMEKQQQQKGSSSSSSSSITSSAAKTSKNNELLLITGSGPKGKLDSLSALQRLQKKSNIDNTVSSSSSFNNSIIKVGVAFNPFFPKDEEYIREKERLLAKLNTGQVDKIYLQFGTDLERLSSALQFLTELKSKQQHQTTSTTHSTTATTTATTTPSSSSSCCTPTIPKFEICGSIFLPTKKLIAQQKFRPWNGVFLSAEFLSSTTCAARSIVLQMMRMYNKFGCEILIEAPGVRNEKDWMIVESLLTESRDDVDESVVPKNNIGRMMQIKAETLDNCSSHQDEKGGDSSVKRRKANPTSTDKPINVGASVVATTTNNNNNFPPSSILPIRTLQKTAIVLFHSHDVRLHDNVALQLASHHKHVIPVFLWSKAEQGRWGVTGCLEVILKDALRHLATKLERHDLKLICREGTDSSHMLRQICEEYGDDDDDGIGVVYWNKEHTAESRIREERYRATLTDMDVNFVESQSSLLYDPMDVSLSGGFRGGHWGTLMPFLKGCKKQCGEPRVPISRADTFSMLERMVGPTDEEDNSNNWLASIPIDELDMAVIRGKDKWDASILERFRMSEEDALKDMDQFFSFQKEKGKCGGFAKYEQERSRADMEGSTSKLSAHLRIGTLSPNELYYRTEGMSLVGLESKTFSRRLFWRDLAYFHLHSFPEMRDKSIRLHYEDTKWCSKEEEEDRYNAWRTGRTGFPLVDAGMRELYATGWMTQSIRMVVASFLVEYLRVNWVKGCEWFHYTLVDADSAINPMMWQNAGRSGIDQWNFILSPVAASQDATGEYTRKWVPELSKLPNSVLHEPWKAPAQVLRNAGVVLGENYPTRIVFDIKAERVKSAEAVLEMRRQNQQFNTDRGYDLIRLPGGEQTVVFTKKEFRIDQQGRVMKEVPRNKSSQGKSSSGGRGRRGKAAQKKILRQKAAAKS